MNAVISTLIGKYLITIPGKLSTGGECLCWAGWLSTKALVERIDNSQPASPTQTKSPSLLAGAVC
jgi:hypothetical protein